MAKLAVTYRKITDLHPRAGNAAGSPDAVKALIRPELWSFLDDTLITSTAVSEWDRLTKNIPAGNIAMSSNALAAPTGTPLACSAVLTTAAGGVAPIFVGAWGAVDVIRDPYSDAQSGGLRITALATMDVTVNLAAAQPVSPSRRLRRQTKRSRASLRRPTAAAAPAQEYRPASPAPHKTRH